VSACCIHIKKLLEEEKKKQRLMINGGALYSCRAAHAVLGAHNPGVCLAALPAVHGVPRSQKLVAVGGDRYRVLVLRGALSVSRHHLFKKE